MIKSVCIYEDIGYEALYPLTFNRPAYDLLLGIDRLFDKFERFFGTVNMSLHCRPILKKSMARKYSPLLVNQLNIGSPTLFINGRVVMTPELFDLLKKNIKRETHSYLFTYQGQVVAMYLQTSLLDYMKKTLTNIPQSKTLIEHLRPQCITSELKSVHLISRLWDLINYNLETIKTDFNYKDKPGIIKGDIKPLSVIYEDNNVFIDKGTVVEDFVLLDATNGPIYIEKDVHIEAHSRLEGPLFIGSGSRIQGGKIKASSIGKMCKVAGEISHSILYQHTNKAHAGFIGHSYLGEWVNLGAHTTNSNLKNTYGDIKLDYGSVKENTKQTFLGSFLGDHVKTGINTTLNTGTLVGYGSNIFGPTLHAKYVPPFSWGSANNYQPYDLDKFLLIADRAMARRNQQLHPDDKEIITFCYNNK